MKHFAAFLGFTGVAAVRRSQSSSSVGFAITEDTEPYQPNWYRKQLDSSEANFVQLNQLFSDVKISQQEYYDQLNEFVGSSPTRYVLFHFS